METAAHTLVHTDNSGWHLMVETSWLIRFRFTLTVKWLQIRFNTVKYFMAVFKQNLYSKVTL
jgi:hypothetical protein